jgi:hypothetical protein
MLSQLDCIIFPDRCEVIEIVPSQRYVYPIFKNCSSSISSAAKQNKWRTCLNEQINKINNIDVILREPQDRLISGINTFIQHVLRDNPDLDQKTVQWFAQNYLFLNRHYCPQFLWLVNLARFLNIDTKLNFISMDDVRTITTLHKKPIGITPASADFVTKINEIKNNEMHHRIDTILFRCIGKSMSFGQLLQYINNTDPTAYEYVIGRSQQILKSTYALPQA